MSKKTILISVLLFCFFGKSFGKEIPLKDRVLIIKNTKSPVSIAVADDYMKRRKVTHVLGVNCRDGAVDPDAQSIEYKDYVTLIEAPIRAYLTAHSEIDFIVFTKGVPIRIYNTPEKPYGGVCALDSRVSSIGYESSPTSSVVHVTDPNYGPDYVSNTWANKYFNSQEPFSHQKFGGYLVTRLDGYTQVDAIALTTRALAAENKSDADVIKSGKILLDACADFGFPDPNEQPYTLIPNDHTPGDTIFIVHESPYGEYNSDMQVAKDYLTSKNIPVSYENTDEFVGKQNNLMGYTSWGSNDTHYDPAAYTSLTFAPGAIGETAVSTSARTFFPTDQGQSLIEDLIKQGITGVKGYTDEPLLQGIASPSILFNRYTRGWTLAESYYAASRLVGWMDIIIGDPLCRPYYDEPAIPVGPVNGKVIFYPNPTTDIIKVNLDGEHHYSIYDLSGRIVKKAIANKQIDITALNNGVYIISLSSDGKEIRKKIIKRSL